MVTTYAVGQYASGFSSESHTAGWDRAYKASQGGRGIIWCHSAGSTSSQEPWITAGSIPLMRALTSLGLPMMSGDFSGVAWGNSTAQTLVSDAWSWITAQYGAKNDKVILAGVSMGGCLALNWARANPSLVKAVLIFYPAVSLLGIWNGTGGATQNQASLSAAYGGQPPSSFDPGQNASAYADVPIYMAYSDADTVVGTANQSAFISGVGGSALTSRVYHNATHADMTQVSLSDVMTWIGSYT